ncbi:MAG: hypothetical protein AAFO79_03220 [Pseudomonadota bacterium]
MANVTMGRRNAGFYSQQRRAEQREYQAFYFLSLPFFLVLAAMTAPLPTSMRLIPREVGRGILGDARAMAHQTIPFIFMR